MLTERQIVEIMERDFPTIPTDENGQSPVMVWAAITRSHRGDEEVIVCDTFADAIKKAEFFAAYERREPHPGEIFAGAIWANRDPETGELDPCFEDENGIVWGDPVANQIFPEKE